MIEKIGDTYIKRSKFWGDRIVFPFKNEDGSLNWFNITTGGAWGKLLTTFIIFLMIMASIYAYKNDVRQYREITNACFSKPCQWCEVVQRIALTNQESNQAFNLSLLNLSIINEEK